MTPFHWPTVYADTVAWYVSLAKQPGWKEYVWRQVNDMAKEDQLWEMLPADVLKGVKA